MQQDHTADQHSR